MAVLGKIREKSIFLIIVIGLALFAFIISGAIGSDYGNIGPNEPIGEVDGEEVLLSNYRSLVEQDQKVYGSSTIESVNKVWDQYILSLVLKSQIDLLEIDAGRNQIEQVVSSDQNLTQDSRFINEAGFFDFGLFTNFISQIRDQNPSAYESWKLQESNIISSAKQSIYFDLVRSGLLNLKSQKEIITDFKNTKVDFQYVKIPFSSLSDTLFKLDDNEIDNYIKKNKSDYVFKPIRNIEYVVFFEQPTDEDEKQIRTQLESLIKDKIEYNEVSKLNDTLIGFKNTNEIFEFVERNSDTPFDSVYLPKGRLSKEYSESLFNLDIGEVYGPYKDLGSLKISRLLDRKIDGSIRASQILISYNGSSNQNPNINRSKEEAKKLANDLFFKIRRNPKSFSNYVQEFSDGAGKSTLGDIGFFQEKNVLPEIFSRLSKSRIERLNLIETDFGFHIIKATDKQDVLLMANVVKNIIPSEETSNKVFRNATKFEMDLLNSKETFNLLAEQNGYNIRRVNEIDRLDETLPGLPNQRSIVQWLFNENTEEGMVKRFNLSFGGYAIVKVIEINEDGLVSSNEVRSSVRTKLINQKKSNYILNSEGNSKIQDIAAKYNLEIIDASLVSRFDQILVGAGNEPNVIGVAFSLDKNETSKLIVGNEGLYKIKLTNINTNSEDEIELNKTEDSSEIIFNPDNFLEALKDNANIIDNRHLYY
ncbi:MAG: peptidylprolyl isomerase [Bacteroidota bacterium]|nr:peptidylprolyl isomerase [Bacteroidota bacterium]|tara:strand:+ start:1276 stop:3384 length:2109 start_codon:yes stop_codon:yes gene_type:complete